MDLGGFCSKFHDHLLRRWLLPFPGGKLSNHQRDTVCPAPLPTPSFLVVHASSLEATLHLTWGRYPFHVASPRPDTPPPLQSRALLSRHHTSHHTALISPPPDPSMAPAAYGFRHGPSRSSQGPPRFSITFPFPVQLPFSSSVLQTLCFPTSVLLLTLVPPPQVPSYASHSDSLILWGPSQKPSPLPP